MRIEFLTRKYLEVACDMLAYPVFEGEKPDSDPLASLDKATRGIVAAVLDSGEFKTDLHHACVIHHPAGLKAGRLLLIGAGKKEEFTLAILRQVAGTAARAGRGAGCKSVALLDRGDHDARESAQVITEGVLYGQYDSDIHKTRDKDERAVDRFVILSKQRMARSEAEAAIGRGTIIGEATNFARSLVDEPANILTPAQFAERALAVGARVGLDVQILEREELEKLGMNTMLAVSRGSEEPPKLLVLRIPELERKARDGAPFHALIGKGVTFDSGGISIKPAEKMERMKGDMAGGAAVLGAMIVFAQIRPRHRVIGLIPVVENLPSGSATRPGDVVRAFSGKTVEIINTDAEGRLILADALAYARTLGATNLIDIATLTGAVMVALGMVNAGVMGTDQKTIDRMRKNVYVAGEKFWQLPLDDEYRRLIRSEVADIKNVGNRWGGAITAAKFLQEFAESTPWVHLDIAGMEYDDEGHPYCSKGATGFGLRTLVQLMMS